MFFVKRLENDSASNDSLFLNRKSPTRDARGAWSNPLLEGDMVLDPIHYKETSYCAGQCEHVERKNVVCEGVLRNREDRNAVADSKYAPRDRTVFLWVVPKKNNRRNRRPEVSDDCDVEGILNCGRVILDKVPQNN